MGASSVGADKEAVDRMKRFVELAGMAFQIKDDLFDYGSDAIGKPTGNDIREKKLTLPLIYTLSKADAQTRRRIIYIIKNQNKTPDKIREVITMVKETGGIEYTQKKMYSFRDEALSVLQEFDNAEIRNALEELVRFTTDRKF
jgi:octaprenyl-diphosphate synthase